MSRICNYELRGWDAEGKPLSEKQTDEIFDFLDEIGADDCGSEMVANSPYITSFQTEYQGASGDVDEGLKKFSEKYPNILLELDYACPDEDIRSLIRYHGGEAEAVDAVITFPPFKKLLLPTAGWILTDSDTDQHIRPLGDRRFECIDMGMRQSGTCYVSRRTIDLNDYELDEDFCETYLKPYDYDSVQDVQEQYSGAADQIMVECIFETEMWEQDNIVYASTEDACRAYIRAVVNE